MSRKASKKGAKMRGSDPSSEHVKMRGSKNNTPKGSLVKTEAKASITLATQPHQQEEEETVIQNAIVRYCHKRKAFSKFVMGSGIKGSVVRALVALYEEPKKPDNAMDYLLCFMGADLPTEEETKAKLKEIRTMRERIDTLEVENERLKERLTTLEEEAMKRLAGSENIGEYEGDEEGEDFFEEGAALLDNLENFDPFDSCVTSNIDFSKL